MERKEIIFYYMESRRHATIVNNETIKHDKMLTEIVQNPRRYVGTIEDYKIYSLSTLITQFSFIAVKDE